MFNLSKSFKETWGLNDPGRALNIGAVGTFSATVVLWFAAPYMALDGHYLSFADFAASAIMLSAVPGLSGMHIFFGGKGRAAARLWAVMSIVLSSLGHLVFGDPKQMLVSGVIGIVVLGLSKDAEAEPPKRKN